jgi:uncharacterized protein (DUF885 family)
VNELIPEIHYMKKLLIFSLLALSACKKSPSHDAVFDDLCRNYFDDKNRLSPLDATQNGQSAYNGELQLDMTDGFRKDARATWQRYRDMLAKTDTASLDPQQKISFGIISWETGHALELLKYPTNLMPLNQFWGTHITMGQFAGGTGAQPFKTEKDYRNFLARMDKYAVWIDSAMVYMRKGIAQKVVLPRPLTEKLIPEFEDVITEKPEDNLFYSSIKLMPDSFTPGLKKDLQEKYAAEINDRLNPQFRKMAAFLKDEYLPASRPTSGIGAFAFGREMYAAYAAFWTTTEMSPRQIHSLGLKEVARIRSEMEKVKARLGYKGTLREFLDAVRKDPKLKPYKTPEEVLAHFQSIYDRIKPNLGKLFSQQPKTPFEIRRTEAFREKSASAEYNQGSADGTRPGIFYVPVPDAKNYNVLEDEDLFLHEAIPGHHFQISLQQENTSLPDFRRFAWFGAFGEGWALYCESLGKELGLYTDPYQYLGMLDDDMHRAIRLVVDTGIHDMGWTREQAIRYSLENEAETEDAITAEIERYMAIPGQALSYKIGQLKIMELRDEAKARLGSRFDIRDYHKLVLENGVMPLELLESNVRGWTKSAAK